MSYVVRVTHPEEGDKYKVYRALPDAKGDFERAERAVPESRIAAYLYEVPGEDNPSAAVKAVKSGNAVILDRDQFADWVKDAEKYV